jgi:TRAP-type mannitol/chloroaromatic compound transport system substrate-binding protein
MGSKRKMSAKSVVRGVVAGAVLGVAVAGLSAGAGAQDKKVRVQFQSNFNSTLPVIGQAAKYAAETIEKVSGGTINVRYNEPGALVPPGQSFDAVAAGSLDAAWATPGFWTGKDIAFALYASVPFGPNAGEYLAWMKWGGGEKMMQELYKKYKIHSMLCGMIPPEASGWFRKEIKSLDDLKGLKMRFFGLGAVVMQKLGVSTQLLQAGEIFQALQLGTIDATEFSMPASDLQLGFHQVAKHYYFPGWHQQSTFSDLMLSEAKWNELSATQKRQVEVACDSALMYEFSLGEAEQFKAMKEIQSKGVTIHRWPDDIIKQFEKAWLEVVEETKAKSPEFTKGWESYSKFRADYAIWRENGYLK